MGIRVYKPTSAGRRGMTGHDFSDLTPGKKPEKKLTKGKSGTGGHGNTGRITVRFRGGGHKRKLREIDFRRQKTGVPAKVAAIEYDPNRTARIALLQYADGVKAYILAPVGRHTDARPHAMEQAANRHVVVGKDQHLHTRRAGDDISGLHLALFDRSLVERYRFRFKCQPRLGQSRPQSIIAHPGAVISAAAVSHIAKPAIPACNQMLNRCAPGTRM